MIWFLTIATLSGACAIAALYYLVPTSVDLPAYYAANIRVSLFSGLLTVGSFLLSLKAFIVVKLKENIFDSATYGKRFERLRKINSSLTRYGPIRRLSRVLFAAIASAIGAAVAQLSIGLLPTWWATATCVFLAAFAVTMLVSTLFVIKRILDEWFEYLENPDTNAESDKSTANDFENRKCPCG